MLGLTQSDSSTFPWTLPFDHGGGCVDWCPQPTLVYKGIVSLRGISQFIVNTFIFIIRINISIIHLSSSFRLFHFHFIIDLYSTLSFSTLLIPTPSYTPFDKRYRSTPYPFLIHTISTIVDTKYLHLIDRCVSSKFFNLKNMQISNNKYKKSPQEHYSYFYNNAPSTP